MLGTKHGIDGHGPYLRTRYPQQRSMAASAQRLGQSGPLGPWPGSFVVTGPFLSDREAKLNGGVAVGRDQPRRMVAMEMVGEWKWGAWGEDANIKFWFLECVACSSSLTANRVPPESRLVTQNWTFRSFKVSRYIKVIRESGDKVSAKGTMWTIWNTLACALGWRCKQLCRHYHL